MTPSVCTSNLLSNELLCSLGLAMMNTDEDKTNSSCREHHEQNSTRNIHNNRRVLVPKNVVYFLRLFLYKT